ncbi:MAG: NAD(P)/FAD-dependent oxidoreductase [Cyanosarcina radialis HA8281-LM2]|jgi:NADH dehydrogenase|nr:NAD(P)/FAD-dependent oxidoreductase [Cyanosarcina radialis HA8281-LM2]
MTDRTSQICILGGGFGGLYTALRLSQLPWEKHQKPEIVLVDRCDRFLFAPLLYELVTGEMQTWEIAPPFVELLAGTGVRFCQGAVASIHIEDRRVDLQDGVELHYDRLVLALGGETPLDLVPGAAEYAIPFKSLADAYRLETQLDILEASEIDKIRVAIVGGGYSGVELACKLADRLQQRGRLRLIELSDTILSTSSDFNRQAAQKALEERHVWLDLDTKVEKIEPNAISLLYKGQSDTIPVELVLWTVGMQVAEVVRQLPLPHDARGKLTTLPTLQVSDRPEIFALGDLADCRDAEGQQLPATAQVAYQQADYAAWNIWASLSDRPLLPLRYFPWGEMMTLGADNATLTGLGLKLDGLPAYVVRRLAYLYRMPTLAHQLKVGFNWIAQPLLEAFSN